MFFRWNDPSVRLTGRWSRFSKKEYVSERFMQDGDDSTTTTAPGSYFEFAFTGRAAVLQFDVGYKIHPYPHLWICVDGGARVETAVDRYLRVEAKDDGYHTVKVIYKGGMEMLSRWYRPLMGAVSFMGFHAKAAAVLPLDERKIIEFIGDSITEGVLIDCEYDDVVAMAEQVNRTYQDDNCATYAALTAEKLDLRPVFQAYGAVGLTREGCASVPRAGLIYPYVYDGVLYSGEIPDIVVINHGTNDREATPEAYLLRYEELLDQIIHRAPKALVVCLAPFCGCFGNELEQFVSTYNHAHPWQKPVQFVSSKGWVPVEPIHPLREGHTAIAERFIPILKSLMEENNQ